MVDRRATLRYTAKKLGISKSTLHKDLTRTLPEIDWVLYTKVREVLDFNKESRAYKGSLALFNNQLGGKGVVRFLSKAVRDRCVYSDEEPIPYQELIKENSTFFAVKENFLENNPFSEEEFVDHCIAIASWIAYCNYELGNGFYADLFKEYFQEVVTKYQPFEEQIEALAHDNELEVINDVLPYLSREECNNIVAYIKKHIDESTLKKALYRLEEKTLELFIQGLNSLIKFLEEKRFFEPKVLGKRTVKLEREGDIVGKPINRKIFYNDIRKMIIGLDFIKNGIWPCCVVIGERIKKAPNTIYTYVSKQKLAKEVSDMAKVDSSWYESQVAIYRKDFSIEELELLAAEVDKCEQAPNLKDHMKSYYGDKYHRKAERDNKDNDDLMEEEQDIEEEDFEEMADDIDVIDEEEVISTETHTAPLKSLKCSLIRLDGELFNYELNGNKVNIISPDDTHLEIEKEDFTQMLEELTELKERFL